KVKYCGLWRPNPASRQRRSPSRAPWCWRVLALLGAFLHRMKLQMWARVIRGRGYAANAGEKARLLEKVHSRYGTKFVWDSSYSIITRALIYPSLRLESLQLCSSVLLQLL